MLELSSFCIRSPLMRYIFCKKHPKNEIELILTERSSDSPLLCKQCFSEKQNLLNKDKLFKVEEYNKVLRQNAERLSKIPLQNVSVPKDISLALDNEKMLLNEFCAFIEAEKSKIQIKYSSLFVEISHLLDKKKQECVSLLEHQKNILKEAYSNLRSKIRVCFQGDISAYEQISTEDLSRVKDYKELHEFILNKNVIFREIEDLLHIVNNETLEEYRSGLVKYARDISSLGKLRPIANLIANPDQSIKKLKEQIEVILGEFNLVSPALENVKIENYITSEHLVTTQDLTWLTPYISPDSELKLTLLYRGSKEKFSAKRFREKCGGVFPLLLVAKSNLGKVFGAYTEEKWSKEPGERDSSITSQNNSRNLLLHHVYTKGKKTMLFSLSKREIYPLKVTTEELGLSDPVAIQDNPNDGPIFGMGDLYIPDQADSNNCSSSLGNSFSTDPISYSESKSGAELYVSKNEAMNQLGGDALFTLEEVDIYRVEKN